MTTNNNIKDTLKIYRCRRHKLEENFMTGMLVIRLPKKTLLKGDVVSALEKLRPIGVCFQYRALHWWQGWPLSPTLIMPILIDLFLVTLSFMGFLVGYNYRRFETTPKHATVNRVEPAYREHFSTFVPISIEVDDAAKVKGSFGTTKPLIQELLDDRLIQICEKVILKRYEILAGKEAK